MVIKKEIEDILRNKELFIEGAKRLKNLGGQTYENL